MKTNLLMNVLGIWYSGYKLSLRCALGTFLLWKQNTMTEAIYKEKHLIWKLMIPEY